MSKLDPDIQIFRRAAGQRLETTRYLLRAARYIDCIYLGGYVVECSLKVLILANTPKRDRARFLAETFRGRLGHDFDRLRHILRRQRTPMPAEIVAEFQHVAYWSTDIRYRSRAFPREDAERLVEAAEAIYRSMERSI